MKFTPEQVEFLLTKMNMKDIEEAKDFVPVKKTTCSKPKKNGDPCKNKSVKDGACRVHSGEVFVKKPLTSEEKCSFVKKDGNCCSFKRKTGEFCGRHSPKPKSPETVVESDPESGSSSE